MIIQGSFDKFGVDLDARKEAGLFNKEYSIVPSYGTVNGCEIPEENRIILTEESSLFKGWVSAITSIKEVVNVTGNWMYKEKTVIKKGFKGVYCTTCGYITFLTLEDFEKAVNHLQES